MDQINEIEVEQDSTFSGNVKVRRLLNTVPEELLALLDKLEKDDSEQTENE